MKEEKTIWLEAGEMRVVINPSREKINIDIYINLEFDIDNNNALADYCDIDGYNKYTQDKFHKQIEVITKEEAISTLIKEFQKIKLVIHRALIFQKQRQDEVSEIWENINIFELFDRDVIEKMEEGQNENE